MNDHESTVGTLGMPGDADSAVHPRCPHCDYILLGLDSARCPECGTAIDWDFVTTATQRGRLPSEYHVGWQRWRGFGETWLLILFRPRHFAERLSERSPTWVSMAFAIVCMAVGITINSLLGFDRLAEGWVLAWVYGVLIHNELQSLLFLLADFRAHRWVRQWAQWRKLSYYTTAFVTLDVVAGPPVFHSYTEANFAWPFDTSWWQSLADFSLEALWGAFRAVAYYWWMVVLTICLWIRLRRKWAILVILVLMPGVTMVSCRLGYHATEVTAYCWDKISS